MLHCSSEAHQVSQLVHGGRAQVKVNGCGGWCRWPGKHCGPRASLCDQSSHAPDPSTVHAVWMDLPWLSLQIQNVTSTEGRLSNAFLDGVIDLKHLSHPTGGLRNRLCNQKGISLSSGLTVLLH